ncbi:hypothetical protein ACJJIL_03150 [Microbulbifer sp. EKSA005]|uniref:hypothetical protein n=1 Tax=Microbulbifer sp. EKSA005 TaxID=3243364 RepID=UPI00404236D3
MIDSLERGPYSNSYKPKIKNQRLTGFSHEGAIFSHYHSLDQSWPSGPGEQYLLINQVRTGNTATEDQIEQTTTNNLINQAQIGDNNNVEATQFNGNNN